MAASIPFDPPPMPRPDRLLPPSCMVFAQQSRDKGQNVIYASRRCSPHVFWYFDTVRSRLIQSETYRFVDQWRRCKAPTSGLGVAGMAPPNVSCCTLIVYCCSVIVYCYSLIVYCWCLMTCFVWNLLLSRLGSLLTKLRSISHGIKILTKGKRNTTCYDYPKGWNWQISTNTPLYTLTR